MKRGLSVGDVISQLLPFGSLPGLSEPNWEIVPKWAPDVFAVTATLAQRSGFYAEPGLILSRSNSGRKEKAIGVKRNQNVGQKWATEPSVPREVQEYWDVLISAWNKPLCSASGGIEKWKLAAAALLAITDEACSGVGYIPNDNIKDIQRVVFAGFAAALDRTKMPFIPNSITHLVSADIVQVLPKASTPEVGCTLRSLTHNLALLPGKGNVEAEWYLDIRNVDAKDSEDGIADNDSHVHNERSLNLLLIPFPYVVLGTDFRVARSPTEGADGYFGLTQGWLRHKNRRVSETALAAFVTDLIQSAERETGTIHGVVFPEAALTAELALDLAKRMARRFPNLELVVSGTIRPSGKIPGSKSSELPPSLNEVALISLDKGEPSVIYVQSKHHRWRLNDRQIRQYQLGHILDPEANWWEHIDIPNRKVGFALNRRDAVLSALICEDLARYDPVLPAITAVGPTLVFALLMDGPQLEARWSGRYATVLAEDPGSSILTLTCLGMIQRSRLPGQETKFVVGLWKDRESPAVELTLPKDNHGLVLCLSSKDSRQRSLDGRDDGGATIEYRLAGVRPIRLKAPPKWLERN